MKLLGVKQGDKSITFYHVFVGEFVWVDGCYAPDKVTGTSGISFKGCKYYPNGAFVIGAESNVNYENHSILHVNQCECFNNYKEAHDYFQRIQMQ